MVTGMDFIREKIKEKPIDKKTVLTKIGISILCGIVFAISACTVMYVVLSKWKNTQRQETQTAQNMKDVQETEQSQHLTETRKEQITQEVSLTLSDYQNLQNELYAIGDEVTKSIVNVTGIINKTDWMNNSYETKGQGIGVILSYDENYVYVLTEKNVISDASKVGVTFVDNTYAEATVLKSDENTGLVILTVQKNKLEIATQNVIAAIKWGTSSNIKNGNIVIALGSFLGTSNSILTGNIITTENKIMIADKNYSLFTTNIVVDEKSSGLLVNTNGEVIGVVMQRFHSLQNESILTAVAISEISDVIYHLSEGKDVPYIGLYVSTVTDKISETYHIPKGVFIKQVAENSPAMRAGLQNGDVIIKINGETVNTDSNYSSKITKLLPGTTCEVIVKRQNGDEYYDVICEVEIGTLQ